MSEELKLLIVIPFILILIVLSEFAAKKKILQPELSRKLLHISIGILVAFSPQIFVDKYYPLAFGVLSACLNFLSIKKNILKNIDPKERHSYGTVYFSISFFVLVLLFWDTAPFIITSSFLIFTIGDFFAGITDKLFKKANLLNITNEPKTVQGAIGNLISSSLVMFLLYAYYREMFSGYLSDEMFLLLLIMTVTISTVIEIVSTKGMDNLFLPLFLALFLYIQLMTPEHFKDFIVGFVLGGLIALASVRFRFLSQDGAIGTFILATFIYGLGGWAWTLPIFSFFVLSSLLSKLSDLIKFRQKLTDEINEKGSRRDIMQVIANGGMPFVIIVLNYVFPDQIWYLIYCVIIAVHTSDTWSTETGTAFGKKTFLITNFKVTKIGTSGGISLPGMIGGLSGSFVIILISGYFVNLNLETVIIMIVSGFAGNLLDSIIGATVQAKYECKVCKKETEKQKHCLLDTRLIKGYRFINNDFVNIFSAGLTGIIFCIIFLTK